MNQLLSISSSDERMKLIEEERHKGSMPMELFLRLIFKLSNLFYIIHLLIKLVIHKFLLVDNTTIMIKFYLRLVLVIKC